MINQHHPEAMSHDNCLNDDMINLEGVKLYCHHIAAVQTDSVFPFARLIYCLFSRGVVALSLIKNHNIITFHRGYLQLCFSFSICMYMIFALAGTASSTLCALFGTSLVVLCT